MNHLRKIKILNVNKTPKKTTEMKYVLFAITCLVLVNVISANADYQMKKDMQQQSYTM